MPKSMTAFARGEYKDARISLQCELRSVNSRYLDLNLHIPEALRDQEGALREVFRQRVPRGKVSCTISMEVSRDPNRGIGIDQSLATAYLKTAGELAKQMDQVAPLNPFDVLRAPGVLQADLGLPEDLDLNSMQLVNQVLAEFIQAREREGEALKIAILERIDTIEKQIDIIAESLPDIRARMEDKLRNKINELNIEANSERLEQELVFQAQRMDVDEEIDRIRTHLVEFRRQLDSEEPIGRRLDFLAQELNREANTLASKSQAALSTQVAVEIKVCIEQIREQIQNIE